jgi:hypothetical protein
MIVINNEQIELDRLNMVEIPCSELQQDINLYTQYTKGTEDLIELKLKVLFKDNYYYISDKDGKVKELFLDGSKSVVFYIDNIPLKDKLYLEINYISSKSLYNYGNLKIDTRR